MDAGGGAAKTAAAIGFFFLGMGLIAVFPRGVQEEPPPASNPAPNPASTPAPAPEILSDGKWWTLVKTAEGCAIGGKGWSSKAEEEIRLFSLPSALDLADGAWRLSLAPKTTPAAADAVWAVFDGSAVPLAESGAAPNGDRMWRLSGGAAEKSIRILSGRGGDGAGGLSFGVEAGGKRQEDIFLPKGPEAERELGEKLSAAAEACGWPPSPLGP